jgi:hypothetical protein
MAAFTISYQHNTLYAAIWYMVISAVEDGERIRKGPPDMTVWSVSSFTAKQ